MGDGYCFNAFDSIKSREEVKRIFIGNFIRSTILHKGIQVAMDNLFYLADTRRQAVSGMKSKGLISFSKIRGYNKTVFPFVIAI